MVESADTKRQKTEGQAERRPMTLPEKILCHHAIGLKKPEVEPGQMICVKVQWTLACEITWKSMDKTYDDMGRPRIWRNDRFWLAVDHTVDPRASEDFAKEANIVDFYKPNTTILHTEFYRQRAQPGQVVVGADSHSCSTGGLGAFAIGLGAADVVMPLVTGETWIKVPETILVEFTGSPPFGMGGKDVMLYTLRQLKCNTVAVGRCVEWGGNISALSCDARFAIANMTAEFGGIAGVFPADAATAAYISKREQHKDSALYFRADPDAAYAGKFQIPLDDLVPQVALFPSPDNGVDVTEVLGKPLDGVFIGACTTTEEDLILAALVLEAGLKQGLQPCEKGQRRVTPGSTKIVDRLRKLGLADVYEQCGFTVGAPGCSYCLGIAADVAGEGEVWLSSQNRNYRNRMGKGSIGNLASAATVAASSFDMKIADPRPLLAQVDQQRYRQFLGQQEPVPLHISEPRPELAQEVAAASTQDCTERSQGPSPEDPTESSQESLAEELPAVMRGRAQVFGDNIDTDAILPGEFLTENDINKLGQVAFLYTNPDFRDRVKAGANIVVGGRGFGCGSSREQAVTAMKGAGVQAIIAKSFGYIFSRNYKNFSLLGIQLEDERFYELVKDDTDIQINVRGRTVEVAGEVFPFGMSQFEERLLAGGGIIPLFKKFGPRLFRVAIEGGARTEGGAQANGGSGCGKTGGVEAQAETEGSGGCGCATGAATGKDIAW